LERRLAAILAADVVGYTALMGEDESGTLRRLTELRQRLLEPLIAKHHGRVVKLMGDGLLIEFASVVDAVTCATAWQRGVGDEDPELKFRIGINLGDVIVEGEDIHGDGVNIASRLEGLAEPGGICLSDDAYRQVRGKFEAAFDDLGEQALKNVAEPVRIYRVSSEPSVSTAATPKVDYSVLPNRPSIAVLPFAVIGGNQDHIDFAEGLAADINRELSRSGMIVVVGHQVSNRHSLETESIGDIGRALAVGYLLSGSVRHAGSRVRISAEMLAVSSGHPHWSERYDRSLDDQFELQEEISLKIAGAVEPALHRSEIRRINQSPPRDLRPNELMLRAWRTSDEGREEGNRLARLDCEEAIRRDPSYADAYSQLAWIHWLDAVNGWTDDPEKAFRNALECAEKGLLLNPKDYDGLGARGAALAGLGRFEAVTPVIDELAKKFPGHAEAARYRADLLNKLGQHQEALELIQYSMEINPEYDQWTWMNLGTCLFCLERFDEAIDAFEQFNAKSKFPNSRFYLAAAYAAVGRRKDAWAQIEPLSKHTDKAIDRLTFSYRNPDDLKRWKMWVREAVKSDRAN
jgi:adenylate cyclase